MNEMLFAILDTNVVVSYFLSKEDSPPAIIVNEVLKRRIVPVYNSYLINEYRKVLSRDEFGFSKSIVNSMLEVIQSLGFGIESFEPMITLQDKKDVPIFELALLTRDVNALLVTGNIKHFPNVDFVVMPKQMMDLSNDMFKKIEDGIRETKAGNVMTIEETADYIRKELGFEK